MAQKARINRQSLTEQIESAIKNGGLLKFVCNINEQDENYLYVEIGGGVDDGNQAETFLNVEESRLLLEVLQTIGAKNSKADSDDSEADDEPQGEPITEAQSQQLAESRAEILQLLDYGILDTKNFGDADLIIALGTGKVYRLTADLSGEVWQIVRLRETTADGQNND